jgi:glycerol-3-phosphate dehydrogenase
MKRDLLRLANESFDLLIIGGGITGAAIARDAVLRGLKVALIERDDFAGATSAHNSKLVHGGLRYLENFEIGLVRESLRERRIWQRIAPHLVRPLPFLLPLYEGGLRGRTTLSAGLALYDLLSFDRTWLDDAEQRLPGHTWLDRMTALEREPVLDRAGLEGAFLYYDAQIYSPERLALECLIDAAAEGTAVANYIEAKSLLLRDGRVEGASVKDRVGVATFDIRAKVTILAIGPWSDIFLARALGHGISNRLLRSKGIHLLVPAMTRGHALTIPAEGGHFFVLPWRGHTLLGTTDTEFDENPDTVSVSEKDIGDFLALVNRSLPEAGIGRETVEFFYAGLRPLVDDGSRNTYTASRKSELVDHGRNDGAEGLYSVIGGKWTTSRALAEKAVTTIVRRLSRASAPCTTASRRLPGAKFGKFSEFRASFTAYPDNPSPHLAHMYGSRFHEMLLSAIHRVDRLEPVGSHGDICAQLVFAVREEMALTLSDAVMRRTGVGQFGLPSSATIARASDVMAIELGWNEERRQHEISALALVFGVQEAA